MNKALTLLALSGLFFLNTMAQPLKTPSPSPTEVIKQDFSLSSIELSYSRPGMKGRSIFGDLVPYGKVWRTGANSATTLTFGEDVIIGGTKVPAGKYGLLTIPGADEWTFIITRQLDVTQPVAYHEDQDVVRVKATPHTMPFSIETLTFFIGDIAANSCNLSLCWDKTVVVLPIETNIDGKIMAQIDNLMNKDSRPYLNAAMYYLDNGKDLNKALEWFNKATAENPPFYGVYQKARCLAKLGRKQEAIAAAKQSIELSKKANNTDYVALNEKLIASLQ